MPPDAGFIQKPPGIVRNSSGFTIIEVIIASVILFSALVIGSIAHRASIRIIEKAEAIIAASDAVPAIVEAVKSELFQNRDRGEGRYGKDIVYAWTSVETASSPNIRSEFSESTGGMELGRFQVILKTVTLNLTCTSYGQNRVFPYEYQELIWFQQSRAAQTKLPSPRTTPKGSP